MLSAKMVSDIASRNFDSGDMTHFRKDKLGSTMAGLFDAVCKNRKAKPIAANLLSSAISRVKTAIPITAIARKTSKASVHRWPLVSFDTDMRGAAVVISFPMESQVESVSAK